MASFVTASGGRVHSWQRWAPYAAIVWSLAYAVLGGYWAVSGHGFPYTPETISDGMGPLLGRFGTGVTWIVVIMAGIPAVAMGLAMLRGMQSEVLRILLVTAGALLTGVLLFLMTGLNLLVLFGYIPYTIHGLFLGEEINQVFLKSWTQWTLINQLICLIGGFLWLAATVRYARLRGNACLYCGRRDVPEDWKGPNQAARWGRIAVYVAMVAPLFYALTRYAWALGLPLGMSEEQLRGGQETGTWISGLFLASFGLVGAILMLGLVQRWGEVFPRWMIGLAGRRVPVSLAVVPASLASVLLIVGGIGILSSYDQLAAAAVATEQNIWIVAGPTFLFPIWGTALAVATLGYYYRRRGPCEVCGRGASDEAGEPSSKYQRRIS